MSQGDIFMDYLNIYNQQFLDNGILQNKHDNHRQSTHLNKKKEHKKKENK